jgi:hypothetical protein
MVAVKYLSNSYNSCKNSAIISSEFAPSISYTQGYNCGEYATRLTESDRCYIHKSTTMARYHVNYKLSE